MSEITFQDLALADPIQRALKAKGYTTPSPIQAKAIPVLLEGHDLLACAQTGTGKTAAFALPVLDGFARNPRKPFRRGVRCLILTPTRELAVQVTESFKTYGEGLGLKVGMVFGGVSERPQIKALYGGLDILVATVGRLLDLKQQGHIDISQVDTFILDEADRMLDMGFIRDIQKIAAAIPQQRHTLLFSATMAPEITKLANGLLHNPKEIRIAPQGTTAEKIDQHVLFVKKADKQNLLLDLIQEHQANANNQELSLVFSRTKHGAKNLARKLCSLGIEADSLHGNKSQNARQKTLDQYKKGEVRVLVATDVAARGIDVKNITLVINFDLPMESDAYVHRIGRTARAGTSGKALSFCSEDEVALLREVEKLIKRSVPVYSHEYHAAPIEHHHTSGAPAQKPKQGGGGGGRGGNRGPRGGGGGARGPRGGGNSRGGPRKSNPNGPRGGGGGKPRSAGASSSPRPQTASTASSGGNSGQRSNRSRGRNR
ncbi:MAG: DEAD/DEAH box helicase [Puniceicoccaceae bacterium]|nr:DEAD/DEAH box helicase [Puniceicoccaceae bacterium]|tara:strand:- start:988 stop:2448 length:1461 start_codon:yes stop_codon:yes gene_type:complete